MMQKDIKYKHKYLNWIIKPDTFVWLNIQSIYCNKYIHIYIPLMISHNSSYILVKTVMKEAIPTIYINIYQWFLIYRFQKMRDWEKARKISHLNIYIYINNFI